MLEKLDREYADWLEETRQKVDVVIDQLDRGESFEVDQVLGGILERFRRAKENIE